MRRINCAVIGAGWWGTTAHVPALLSHRRARLVAVQHHDLAQAQRTARDFGVPHGGTSVRRILDLPGLEAVVISSTPHLHYRQAKAALERGLHVLLEKPMCISAAEARTLVELAAERGRQLVLSAPWHFNRHVIAARKLVRGGALGELKMISILQTNFSAGLYYGKQWRDLVKGIRNATESTTAYVEPGRTSYSDPRISGGGQIYCQASHPTMYLSFVTGRRPAEVFARFENAGAPVDVFDSLSIRLDDGALVSLATHGAPMPSERQFESRIYGTRGMLLMELYKGTLEVHDERGRVKRHRVLALDETYPIHAPANNFIDAIAGTAPNGAPGVDGEVSMEIIEAACRSARSGRNVKVPTRLPLAAGRVLRSAAAAS